MSKIFIIVIYYKIYFSIYLFVPLRRRWNWITVLLYVTSSTGPGTDGKEDTRIREPGPPGDRTAVIKGKGFTHLSHTPTKIPKESVVSVP